VPTASARATERAATKAAVSKPWVLLTLLGLVVLLYGSILKGLIREWWVDPDYGHGFFILPFSVFVLWRRRGRWMNTEITPSNLGLPVMTGAIGLLLLGSLGAELFMSRFSLLVLLAGMVIFLAGWKFLYEVAFPLAFLIFMIPLPAIIYNQITFPLQLIASQFATYLLELVHVPVLRDGNILILSNYSLEIVEACSGIRSLMTLISLAVIYLYFTEPRRWARYLLVVLMVLIAIFSNAIRIMVAGIMAHQFGPAAADGFLHTFSGWAIFVSALLLLFASHWVLKRISRASRGAAHV
jgi:exosortase